MREMLVRAGYYGLGVLTLPVLSLGLNAVDAHTAAQHHRPSWNGTVASSRAGICVSPNSGCGSHQAIVLQDDSATTEEILLQAKFPSVVAQTDRVVPAPAFGTAEETQAFDSDPFNPLPARPPQPHDVTVFAPYSVGPELLATDETLDEEQAAQVKALRDQLKATVEEKAAMLNAQGLEFELKTQQNLLAELKSMKELQALKKGLLELKEKYPNSEAGRRAVEVLNLLEQQRQRLPTPVPDFGIRPQSRPATPYQPSKDSFGPTEPKGS